MIRKSKKKATSIATTTKVKPLQAKRVVKKVASSKRVKQALPEKSIKKPTAKSAKKTAKEVGTQKVKATLSKKSTTKPSPKGEFSDSKVKAKKNVKKVVKKKRNQKLIGYEDKVLSKTNVKAGKKNTLLDTESKGSKSTSKSGSSTSGSSTSGSSSSISAPDCSKFFNDVNAQKSIVAKLQAIYDAAPAGSDEEVTAYENLDVAKNQLYIYQTYYDNCMSGNPGPP